MLPMGGLHPAHRHLEFLPMDKFYLTTEDIIDALEKGYRFGANHMSEAMLFQAIDKIRRERLVLHTDSLEALTFQKLVARGLGLFDPRPVAQLAECDLYVLPEPICVAHSCMHRKRKTIVVSTGMLDLLFAMSYWTHVSAEFPPELEQIKPYTEFRTPAISAFELFSFILIARYYQFGEPLPCFVDLLHGNRDKLVRLSMESAVLFLLVHELGHHTLGHIDADEVRPVISHSILEEDITAYKKKELEADWFVYQSLRSNAKKTFQNMIVMGLNFHSLFEGVLSLSNIEHPLTLNRVYHARQSMEEGAYDKADGIDAHLSNQAEKYISIKSRKEKAGNVFDARFFAQASRQNIIEYIKVLEPHFRPYGLNIALLYEKEPQRWQDALELPS
jgi:hypothetical protein